MSARKFARASRVSFLACSYRVFPVCPVDVLFWRMSRRYAPVN